MKHGHPSQFENTFVILFWFELPNAVERSLDRNTFYENVLLTYRYDIFHVSNKTLKCPLQNQSSFFFYSQLFWGSSKNVLFDNVYCSFFIDWGKETQKRKKKCIWLIWISARLCLIFFQWLEQGDTKMHLIFNICKTLAKTVFH